VQEKILTQLTGNTRFVWNKLCEINSELYAAGEPYWGKYSLYKYLSVLKNSHPFLKCNSNNSSEKVVDAFDLAYKRFFEGTSSRPKWHKKNNRGSITYSQGCKLINNKLTVEYLKDIPVCLDKRYKKKALPTNPVRVTITRVPSGKYYASVTYHVKEVLEYIPTGVVGIDQGLKDLSVTSYRKKVENKKSYRKAQKKLRKEQRTLARRKKGSKRREKQRLKVAKLHEKTAAIRKFHIDRTTTNIVINATSNNHAVAIQVINVKNMKRNRHLAKSISDAGMGYYLSKTQIQSQVTWSTSTRN